MALMNNRQVGRRRGRGGQRTTGNPGRPDNGSRIDNRARGNAAQLLEKYKNLARDAQMQGDRVNTEYYHQFADHYFRVLNENRSRTDENQPRISSRDDGMDGDDEDYGVEGEPTGGYQDEPRYADSGSGNNGGGNDNRAYQGRGNEGRGNEGRNDNRGNGDNRTNDNRGNRNANGQGGQRDYQQRDSQSRDHQPRDAQQRDDRPRENGRDTSRNTAREPYRDEAPRAPRREAAPVAEAEAPHAPVAIDAEAPLPPRRRGRPSREDVAAREAAAAQTHADQGRVEDAGFEPAVIEADRLPPSLSLSSDAPANDEEAPAPRRRGRPRRDAGVPPVA